MKANNNHQEMSSKTTLESRIERNMNASSETQIEEASKILSELEEIDSYSALKKVQNRIDNPSKWNGNFNRIFTRAASILLIPLLASTLALMALVISKHKQEFAQQEVITPEGSRTQITLPDGSHVWLNAESSLKFKIPFNKKRREVLLSGEAYFDVQKNKKSPFIVHSGNTSVKVLGTKFNYKAYKEDSNIEVSLSEGKVQLEVLKANNENNYILNSGDRAVVDKASGTTNITNEKLEKYTDWHKGLLVFDDALISDVAKNLSRWYGIDAVIEDPTIVNYRITTTFENESLQQVIDLLKLSSPLDIRIIPASIDKNIKTRTKIIFKKRTH